MNLRFNELMHDNVAEASLLLGRSPARSDAQRQLHSYYKSERVRFGQPRAVGERLRIKGGAHGHY
jgi:hypothetical protein